MSICTRTFAAKIAIFVLTGTVSAFAQANFTEDFENNGVDSPAGPSNLVQAGWIFRNQSDPATGAAWFDGDDIGASSFEGTGYISTSSLATDFFGGAVSTWAILPDIPNQQIADTLALWIYGGGSSSNDTFFEIRYSPTGGTDTGSGPTDVGDFTDILFATELPLAIQSYVPVQTTLPGNGRIALRFHSAFLMTFAGRGALFSVDSLSVGKPPGPVCGAPLPESGETVTWQAVDSPFTICEDLLVPDGATLIIEPGTVVTVEPGKSLRVEGDLIAHGTALSPIIFNGSPTTGDGLFSMVTGTIDIAHAEVEVQIYGGGENAAIIVRDSTFLPGGLVEGVLDLAVIERCDFAGGQLGGITGIAASVRVTDCTLTNGSAADVAGFLHLDNLTIDGQPLNIRGEFVASPVLLDNLSITNVANGPGIRMYGPNFLIGDNVTTQNNLYPLEITLNGAGLLKGSTLPTTGNTNNYIPVAEFLLGANRYWANTGIPYVVDGFADNRGGSLEIEPGTVVKFLPNAGAFIVLAAQLILPGTADSPITFESFSATQPWFGLKWVDVFNARAFHTIFDDAQIAVQSDGGELLLEHCIVRNSDTGTTSVTGGIVHLRNSRIEENNIGMTTTSSGRIDASGATSPNIFAGNNIAVDYNNTNGSIPRFELNWWDAPSGPTTPQNPDGTGETVTGLNAAWFTPFLDAPPAQTDEPPVVDLMPTYFLCNDGEKIVLRWQSSDDGDIVAQRIEFADHGFPNEYQTIATLPPDATTYEFTAPIVLPTNLYTSNSGIRVVAVDDKGQETWAETRLRIPYQEDITPNYQTIDVPDSVHPHDRIDVCWNPGGTSQVYVLLDGDQMIRSSGGAGQCLSIGATMPYASTDTARLLVLFTHGAGGRYAYSFSDYFEIRPDVRFGDPAPTIEMLSPTTGQSFAGGGTIPITWTASDDEGLRKIEIQASYNGGRTWHFVATDLPPTTTSFDWDLPASTGIADVRIRVIATDWRFQNSSDGADQMLAILPGQPALPGDLNCDGIISVADIGPFVLALTDPASYATQFPDCNIANGDLNNDGTTSVGDIGAFVSLLTGS